MVLKPPLSFLRKPVRPSPRAENEGRTPKRSAAGWIRSDAVVWYFPIADHARDAGVVQAFLHREKDIDIAARLDIDYPIRRKSGSMKGKGDQVSPGEPSHSLRTDGPASLWNPREKCRRPSLVGFTSAQRQRRFMLCSIKLIYSRCPPSQREAWTPLR